jgi:D-alanyl-lipoteichoic acid acyltransferase DltB (MBOAT superfamily)
MKMKGIRIEGISPNIGKVAVVIDLKHILCVLDTYEDMLPCSAFKSLEQYYVMFYPQLNLPPIVTVSELSPGIKEWIDEQLRVWSDIPD